MAPADADPPENNANVTPDALSLLRRDHRLIDELFAELRRSAPQQLDPLTRRICKMLRVHTQIEEELVYPAVRRTPALTACAAACEYEHAAAKALIARIESMTADHPHFKPTLASLSEQIAQHVRNEEQVLFPQLHAAGLDLGSLGIALTERRDTLLDVLGLYADDEEGAANQRETHQTTPPQRPSGKK